MNSRSASRGDSIQTVDDWVIKKNPKPRLKRVNSLLLFLALAMSSVVVDAHAVAQAETKRVSYICPMDRDVRTAKPGKCPRCGMALRRASSESVAVGEPAIPAVRKVSTETSLNLARLPDTVVYDQDGRKLNFYHDLVKGKTVAINFLFTTCKTICPPLAATFGKVQQHLGDRVGRDVALISISVDPATDIPERLKRFASKFDAGLGWTFVTGNPVEIDRLLKSLGAAVADKNDHTPMILVGNEAAGFWTRTYGLSAPAELVKLITQASARSAEAASNVEVPLPAGSSTTVQAKQQAQKIPDTGAQASTTESKATRTPAEKAAAYFPNTVLLTQDNKPVHFFDDLLKGKTVMINFMFTTCTGICPPMTANLLKVQSYLGERVGKDINMISISVDPIVDTPAALKKYAINYKVNGGWYFLTGSKTDVDLVLSKVAGFVKDKNEHSSLVMVGNLETGNWQKVFAMAKPSEIVDSVLRIAGPKKD